MDNAIQTVISGVWTMGIAACFGIAIATVGWIMVRIIGETR